MSAPAFTPGPWSLGPWIDSAGGHVYRVVSSASRRVSGITVYGKRPDGSVGGRALKGGGHTKTIATDECDATANLIAAAPDLYEALQTLVSMHIKRGPFDEPLGSSEQEDEINVACAALTKARGGQA